MMDWWRRFDGILVEMPFIGIHKEDGEKKAKAMFLIGEEYATLAVFRLEGGCHILAISTSVVKPR